MAGHEIDAILKALNGFRTELMGRIDRVEDKVDKMAVNGCARGMNHSDVEKRIRSLEADRAKIMGIIGSASIVGSVVSWIVSHIVK